MAGKIGSTRRVTKSMKLRSSKLRGRICPRPSSPLSPTIRLTLLLQRRSKGRNTTTIMGTSTLTTIDPWPTNEGRPLVWKSRRTSLSLFDRFCCMKLEIPSFFIPTTIYKRFDILEPSTDVACNRFFTKFLVLFTNLASLDHGQKATAEVNQRPEPDALSLRKQSPRLSLSLWLGFVMRSDHFISFDSFLTTVSTMNQ